MGKCPVCEKDYQEGMVCPQCGFDSSRDYERYPTVFAVSGEKSVQALREEWKRKQEPERPPFVPRKGEDLFCVAVISAEQAAQGCQMVVGGYMGKKVSVTIPAQCANGKQLRCRGLGYPSLSGGERGDLYVTVQVETEADEPESAPEPAPPVTERVPQADNAAGHTDGEPQAPRKKKSVGNLYGICLIVVFCICVTKLITGESAGYMGVMYLAAAILGGLFGEWVMSAASSGMDEFCTILFSGIAFAVSHILTDGGHGTMALVDLGTVLLCGLIARIVFASKKKREQQ